MLTEYNFLKICSFKLMNLKQIIPPITETNRAMTAIALESGALMIIHLSHYEQALIFSAYYLHLKVLPCFSVIFRQTDS